MTNKMDSKFVDIKTLSSQQRLTTKSITAQSGNKTKNIGILIKKAYLTSEYYRTTVKTVDMETAMKKALITKRVF